MNQFFLFVYFNLFYKFLNYINFIYKNYFHLKLINYLQSELKINY